MSMVFEARLIDLIEASAQVEADGYYVYEYCLIDGDAVRLTTDIEEQYELEANQVVSVEVAGASSTIAKTLDGQKVSIVFYKFSPLTAADISKQ